jgi:hypothetical protein
MNYSKALTTVIRTIGKFFFALFVLSVFVLFSRCELLDDEHCQYETTESKIWTPDQNTSKYYVQYDENLSYTHKIQFTFNHSSNSFESNFQVTNACPYGALRIKIKITEKDFGVDEVHSYYGNIFEVRNVKGKTIYKKVETFQFLRISEKEFRSAEFFSGNDVSYELNGLLDQGPGTFFISCSAHVFPLTPFKDNEYET